MRNYDKSIDDVGLLIDAADQFFVSLLLFRCAISVYGRNFSVPLLMLLMPLLLPLINPLLVLLMPLIRNDDDNR